MTIVRVGYDKLFLYLSDAYTYASHGDTLLIDEDIYSEELIFDGKLVNLIAKTDFPAEGNVSIYYNAFYNESALQIKYVDPLPEFNMFVEGIRFENKGGNGTSLIQLLQEVSDDTSSLNLVFNKCIFDTSNGIPDYIIEKEFDSGYSVNNITFNNCEIIWNSNDNFVNTDFNLIPKKNVCTSICSDCIDRDVFGLSENTCVSGIITVCSGIDADYAFDGSLVSYATLHTPPSWLGYQFTSPKVIKQLKLRGTTTGYNCEGFTLVASTTGFFSGEEVTLYVNTLSFSSGWQIYEFENDIAFLYVRINSNNVADYWAISEIEFYEVIPENRDYVLTNNNAYGYGPNYGAVLNTLTTHCVSGTVTVNNMSVQREIKFFREDNDIYLGSTVSSGVGGQYYMETQFGGYHNLICKDDLIGVNYNDLFMSKCVPKKLPIDYIIYETIPIQVKSVIIDCADMWGTSISYMVLRSIEFYDENRLFIGLSGVSFTAYATSYQGTYYPSNAFNTSLSKVGVWGGTCWIAGGGYTTNQRLICVLNTPKKISRIIVNNGHNSGTFTDGGAKNAKIYFSSDSVTDTTYGASISNSTLVYDDVFDEHIDSNVIDDQILYTPSLRTPI